MADTKSKARYAVTVLRPLCGSGGIVPAIWRAGMIERASLDTSKRGGFLASLSSILACLYRPATTREIRSWSFGQVKARRKPGATDWQEQVGTLDDQRIFGPLQELACACGKYEGKRYSGMICDHCGVKVTSLSVRRERFGHFELDGPAQHPLGDVSQLINAFPVVPAVFFCSPSGARLAECYEVIAEQRATGAFDPQALDKLVEILLPVVQIAHDWRLNESVLLARGLALELREPVP
jgi:hypothetical protein